MVLLGIVMALVGVLLLWLAWFERRRDRAWDALVARFQAKSPDDGEDV